MDTGCGLFTHALDIGGNAIPVLRIFGKARPDQAQDDLLFLVFGAFGIRQRTVGGIGVFGLFPHVNQQRGVAAVVNDQLRTLAVRKLQDLVRTPPILLQRLPFPRKNRNSGLCNRRSRMVLRTEDVATCPPDIGAESDKAFDQDGGLNRHVQRP